jgi:NAD(P)-dependent dehydrogenase (short-subunit alcohol dehydrogenase family)
MKSILITGASSGFGELTSLELARLGWRVFAAMRDPAKAASLQEAARAASVIERVHVVRLDVTDAASIGAAVSQVFAVTGGTLDVLLNNAGFTTVGFFEDMSDAECRSVMETNFFGAVAVTRAVAPSMRKAGRGRIAFVSSNAVNTPHPTMTMYAASKWAIEGFAEALAMELAPFGVEVVVMQPGNHRTPFGGHVHFLKPAESAYAGVWNALMPGLNELATSGADAASAIPAFVQSLAEPRPPFLRQIGADVELFSSLKRESSFEARAAVVRHFVGFPGRRRKRSTVQ